MKPSPKQDRRPNNFDTIRLLAATAVLLSHAFTLGGVGAEPLVTFSGAQKISLGEISVLTFFAISGYLIPTSYLSAGSAPGFIWRRALRILPALGVVLVISALVIGPLVTTLQPGAYFAQKTPFSYIAWNLVFRTRYVLPGVFATNPYPNAVNGSLWSLAPEVTCYAAVLVIGLTGMLAQRWAMLAIAVIVTGIGAVYPHADHELFEVAAPFAVSALFLVFEVPLDWKLALGALALCTVTLRFGGFVIAASWAGTYLVHYVSRSPSVWLPRLPIDPSYGVYIWAFPVQQLVAQHLRGPQAWLLSVALALPITFALATLSYMLIEKPALRLKRYRARAPGLQTPSRKSMQEAP